MKKRGAKKRIKKRKKKSVSPVIATVLLVSIVIIMGVVIFLWIRAFVPHAVTKGGKSIELVCGDIIFEASYSGGVLDIINSGNVPIYKVKIKIFGNRNYETKDITDLSSDWPTSGLGSGLVFSEYIGTFSDANKILIIPVLIGESEGGEKDHICDDQYGYEIQL